MAWSNKRTTYGMMKNPQRKINRVGVAVPQENRDVLDLNLFAKYLLDTHGSQLKQQQRCLELSEEDPESTETDISFEDLSSDEVLKCSKSGLLSRKGKITSYTQLYNLRQTLNKEVEDGGYEVSGSTCQKEERTWSTRSTPEHAHMTPCSSIISLLDCELESKLSWDGIDWGNCLYCVGDGLGHGNEIMCEQVS